MAPKYSTAQMEEILRRAMQREAAGEISHAELLDAAQEVGIDPADVEAAARELEAEQHRGEQLSAVRADLRRRALGAFGNYLVINALAFIADALTGPEQWYHWVLLGSTALFLRRLFLSLFPGERELERAERRLHKRRQRELKHHDRARWQRERSARNKETAAQFERAVEEGLQALLKVAADKLEKYNRTAEAQGPRVRVEPVRDDAGSADDARDDARRHSSEPRGGPRTR